MEFKIQEAASLLTLTTKGQCIGFLIDNGELLYIVLEKVVQFYRTFEFYFFVETFE